MNSVLNDTVFARRKLLHVRQTEETECGLACLAMVASYFGLKLDLTSLRRQFPISRRGMTFRSLIGIADKLGLSARAVKVPITDIGSLALPAVLHWNMQHFVVLASVKRRRLLVYDPGKGEPVWVGQEEFLNCFTGVALELQPSSEFQKGDSRQRIQISSLWSRVSGLGQTITQTVALSIVIQLFALALPYYLQVVVDRVLPEKNGSFMAVLASGFILFAIINGTATLMRQTVLLSVGSTFGYGLSSNLARRLFRLPIDWFSRRHTGDILTRFQSVVPIRKMLIEDAPAALLDGMFTVLTFALMMVYSVPLSIVAVIALVCFSLIRLFMFRAQRDAQEELILTSGIEQSTLMETVRGIRALRLSGREAARHSVWGARMLDAVNGSIRLQRILNWQSSSQTTTFLIEGVVSVWVAVNLIITGTFTLGMLFAFMAYKSQFINAATNLIVKTADFKMLDLHLERISDIALAQEDKGFQSVIDANTPLKGKIELRNVCFRYSPEDPLILTGVNLTVMPGDFIAITGPSGGGKSTLLQVILGLVEPTSGELLIDDVPLREFGYSNYYRQISAVLQDDRLFGGSLADNICLFDDDPDDQLIEYAARAAAIHADIIKMPMRYQTLVGEMGVALSGGQQQRVLVARALYRTPKIMVMDESTSHLDAEKEKDVNSAVGKLGISRLIVAHRKETILSANTIYCLDGGLLKKVDHSAFRGEGQGSLT